MLEIVFDFEDLNDYKGAAESSSVLLPLIWENQLSHNSFRNLKTLFVKKCGFVKLVPLRVLKSLNNLEELGVRYCDTLELVFDFEDLNDYKEAESSSVTHNLEKLTLQGKGAEMIGSGQLSTYRFPKVKLLHLNTGYDKATTISYKLLWKSFPNLEELTLGGHIKEAFGGGDDVPLPIKLTLDRIPKITSLVPLLVSSPNLTHLHVAYCHKLTTLMTSSVARSLVHLTSLSISWCSNIKEIIWKQEGEDDDDEEVVFRKLQHLKVERLPELKRFCRYNYTFRFPLLDQLIITECPRFKVFSPGLIEAPSLKRVQVSQEWGVKHHEIWDTNLNKTVYQQRFVASREMVLDEDDVSMIKNDQFPVDSCPEVEILGIEGFDDEGVTFPYTLLERLPRLSELHVEDSSFEEIFPSHIVHQIQQLHNLTMLNVSRCHRLIYLMTNSAAKSLVNLETLGIYDCKKMEKIVKNENNDDVEGGVTFSALRRLELSGLPRLKVEEHKTDFNIEDPVTNNHKVSFSKLEILELHSLNSLVPPIWDDKPSHNSFSNLKTLSVSRCGIVKLVPLHVLKYLNNLEELEVKFCDMLETVFYFEDLNDYKEIVSSSMAVPLKELRLICLPKLKNVLSNNHSQGAINLALSLCHQNQIEEIIARQEEEDNEDTEIIFSKLELLELDELPRLKRFCGQNYTFKFPLLQCVTITECPQLTTFCSGAIHAPQLQNVRVKRAYEESHIDIWMTDLNATIQHRFTIQEVISTTESMALNAKNITIIRDVFPEVRTLYVESFKDEGVTFPHSSLESFPMLEKLYVEHSSFEEVFPPQDEIIDFKGKIPPFEELHIAYLDQLKSIWKDDSQLPPTHQDLITRLEVESCHSLVKLVPSFASFQNLRDLFVSGCHQLVYLVTSSSAKSLVSLVWLWINNCKRMEEIVLNENNEGVEGGITFNRLWWIKLTNMPSLKMFSSESQTFEFPGLHKIEITGCPEMKMFCSIVLETPKLSRVKIEGQEMEWKDKRDLNKIVEMLSSAKDSVNIIEG
ncbi:uncharacterized protein LOC114719655 [Neltuma alba]|uniref:uncharacterized protein LOC114719655 n=1 Tax=Neltuma alba TaxID=207710 RepID=UPI0010A57CAA|nr:uncharacterized protein LOC114719655 [Prosopis alba]